MMLIIFVHCLLPSNYTYRMTAIFDLLGRLTVAVICLLQAYHFLVTPAEVLDFLAPLGRPMMVRWAYRLGMMAWVIGSIFILIGYRAKLGASLLLGLLLPWLVASIWWSHEPLRLLLDALGWVGALLLIIANGSHTYSVKTLLAGVKRR